MQITMRIAIFSIFLCLLAQKTSSLVPLSEIFTLKNLYDTTNGHEWNWRAEERFGPRWQFDNESIIVNPCNTNGTYWQGIECDFPSISCANFTCSIISIKLARYGLLGYIPQNWSNLTQLGELDLSINQLSGIIPPLLPLPLQILDVGNNRLNGTIPTTLQLLTQLRYFRITRNQISSSIDNCLIPSMKNLYLEYNLLNGTLPDLIGSLTKLAVLDAPGNLLSGTIPSTIGNLSSITYFHLGYNLLSSSIPSSLVSLSLVEYLDFRDNSLTGSIPNQIGYLTSLSWLSFENNFISSSIPLEIQQLTKLQILDMTYNYLSSSLPCSMSQLKLLRVLDLHGNFFTNFCPDLKLSPLLEQLFLSKNLLFGTIPHFLNSTKSHLGYFEVNFNQLSGPLPEEMIQDLNYLIRIDIGNNHLTGSISFALTEFFHLLQINLQNNRFIGTLNHFLSSRNRTREIGGRNTTKRLVATNIDVSGNKLTGSIPNELYDHIFLESLALTSNCFEGNISPAICQLSRLAVLSFDGLGGARNCPNQVKVPLTNVVYRNLISGTIPDCVWKMTQLQILSLSGNGLTGTLGSISMNSSLINLTLSYNHLEGTIPSTLQDHTFESLDLSYNKLTGIYDPSSSLTSHSNISKRLILEVNRLSGSFPNVIKGNSSQTQLKSPLYLNALTGNLFRCNDIPDEDVNANSYLCGSLLLDISLFSFGCLIVIILLIPLVLIVPSLIISLLWPSSTASSSCSSLLNSIQFIHKYYLSYHTYLTSHISYERSKQSLNEMRSSLIYLFLLLILLTSPLYLLRGLDKRYSTHSHLYRWSWTTAYLSGTIPALILLISWLILISLLIYFIRKMKRANPNPLTTEQQQQQQSQQPQPQSLQQNWLLILEIFFYFSLNILVMGTVNAVYILSYSSTDVHLSPTDLFLIQLAVVVIKIFWTGVCLPILKITKKFKRLKLLIFVLNSVLLPCLVTALTSPSCYQGLLIPSHDIVSSYSYRTCEQFIQITLRLLCVSYSTLEVTITPYTPPFTYNHLCSSTLLSAYIPIYLYSYLLEIILMTSSPFLFSSHGLISSFHNYNHIPIWLQRNLHGILWPNYWIDYSNEMKLTGNYLTMLSSSPAHQMDSFEEKETKSIFQMISHEFLNIENFINKQMQDLVIFMTFGLTCPLLGWLIIWTMVCSILKLQIMIGRYLFHCPQQDHLLVITQGGGREGGGGGVTSSSPILLLVQSIGDLGDGYHYRLWVVVWSSCVFYCLLCWDIAADEMKTLQSIWVPLTCFGYIWMIKGVIRFQIFDQEKERKQREGERGEGVGLREADQQQTVRNVDNIEITSF